MKTANQLDTLLDILAGCGKRLSHIYVDYAIDCKNAVLDGLQPPELSDMEKNTLKGVKRELESIAKEIDTIIGETE